MKLLQSLLPISLSSSKRAYTYVPVASKNYARSGKTWRRTFVSKGRAVAFLDNKKATDGEPCISFSLCYDMLSFCLVLKTEGFKIPEMVSSFLYI
jgi:hypothetical protein